jgi:hypothetical protein
MHSCCITSACLSVCLLITYLLWYLTTAVPSKWCVMTVVPFSSVTGLRCSQTRRSNVAQRQQQSSSQQALTSMADSSLARYQCCRLKTMLTMEPQYKNIIATATQQHSSTHLGQVRVQEVIRHLLLGYT